MTEDEYIIFYLKEKHAFFIREKEEYDYWMARRGLGIQVFHGSKYFRNIDDPIIVDMIVRSYPYQYRLAVLELEEHRLKEQADRDSMYRIFQSWYERRYGLDWRQVWLHNMAHHRQLVLQTLG